MFPSGNCLTKMRQSEQNSESQNLQSMRRSNNQQRSPFGSWTLVQKSANHLRADTPPLRGVSKLCIWLTEHFILLAGSHHTGQMLLLCGHEQSNPAVTSTPASVVIHSSSSKEKLEEGLPDRVVRAEEKQSSLWRMWIGSFL